jgi:lysozyme
MGMTPSRDCIDLIKESEGLHRKLADGTIEAYADPVGIWTIGYGSIVNIDEKRPVRKGDKITRNTAELWLQQEINEKATAVTDLCRVPLTQGMFDALTSFTFNLGRGALEQSTLLRKLNGKDYEGAAREFDRWINGAGRVLPGLVIRRNREEELFRRDVFPGDEVEIPSTGSVTLVENPYRQAELPLKIQRTLAEGSVGEDCYILNCGLAELGYLKTGGSQPNSYTTVTRGAVEWLQSDLELEIDGKLGSKTKAALSSAIAKARKPLPPVLGTVYCRLTRTRTTNSNGLEWLSLNFVSAKGNVLDSLRVVSGAPGHQNFRLLEEGIPGSLEPIPQSRYSIADIDWAGAKNDYDAPHPHASNGLGPVFVDLVRTVPIRDRERDGIGGRDAFGFHADWNFITEGHSPGSAGCVCVTTIDDLKELVRLLRLYDPRDLFVDWGLL